MRPLINKKRSPALARPKSFSFPPLGVDLIEIKKAKLFYEANRNNLGTFFTDGETAYVKKSRKPHVNLARLLAAKEAVFKAMGKGWMGVEGFRKIEIVPGRKNFDFKLKENYTKYFTERNKLKGSFEVNKDYVLARLSGSGRG